MFLKPLADLAEDTKDLTEREKSLSRRIYCLGAFIGVLLGIVITNLFNMLSVVKT